MSKQAKGSIENPNIRASAKSGLNRFILQQSWEKFFELLELIQKTQAKFVCEVCKTEFHADMLPLIFRNMDKRNNPYLLVS